MSSLPPPNVKDEQPPAVSVPSFVNRTRRCPNFTMIEDVALCKAVLLASTDASIGTDQSGDDYWGIVAVHFESEMKNEVGIPVSRVASTLRTRFIDTLQRRIAKFIGHLSKAQNFPKSGANQVDIMNMALHEYRSVEGKPFTHMECYDILKVVPKYQILSVKQNTSQSSTDTDSSSASERPDIGKKKAKLLKQQSVQREAEISIKKQKVASFNRIAAASEVKNRLLEQSMDDAFFASLSPNDPAVIEYKELKTRAILAKHKSMSHKSSQQGAEETKEEDQEQQLMYVDT